MDERLFALAMAYGPKVLIAVLMLVAGYFAGSWAARATRQGVQRYELEPPVQRLVEGTVRVFVFALFLIMALQNLGVDLLPLIAGLGVAGAAVALALQSVLGNVVAGLNIIFSKPFLVGDYIAIVGVHGEVLEIKLATTTLGHADRSRVVIPNRKIVGEILHNYGKIRQISLEVPIPYSADADAALDAARAVLRANARVLRDPVPGVGIAKLTETAVTLSVTPWVAVTDFGAASGELNQALLAAFRNRKILTSSGP